MAVGYSQGVSMLQKDVHIGCCGIHCSSLKFGIEIIHYIYIYINIYIYIYIYICIYIYIPLNDISEQIGLTSTRWTLHYPRQVAEAWHSINLQPSSLNPTYTIV